MIDINNILTSAVQQAIDQAADQILLPYRERIATLEDSNATLKTTVQNLQLSIAKLASHVESLMNRAPTPAIASPLTEDRIRVISSEVAEDWLYRHKMDFDHDPLVEFKETVQQVVEDALEDLEPSLIKGAVSELLSDATISISI
jgi:uncharacterized coiled-coil protein SlyX